jgi:hypothetical protein
MTVDLSRFGFTFLGHRIDSKTYGDDYLTEFCRVLDVYAPSNTASILEWGSGITTQILARYGEGWGSRLLLSMDENQAYQASVFENIEKPSFVRMKTIDQQGPGKSQRDPEVNYSTYPLTIGHKFDLIFIDGRRRMECAFISAMLSHHRTIVIIHDYRRARYQPILALFNVIEDGSQFRVLQPREGVLQSLELGGAMTIGYIRGLVDSGVIKP